MPCLAVRFINMVNLTQLSDRQIPRTYCQTGNYDVSRDLSDSWHTSVTSNKQKTAKLGQGDVMGICDVKKYPSVYGKVVTQDVTKKKKKKKKISITLRKSCYAEFVFT